MAAPLLQAQIDIDAPRREGVGIDLRSQPDAAMEPAVPIDEGARPAAARHPDVQPQPPQPLFWPTTCTVTEVIPEKKLAFRVNANGTIWSYELEPTDVGTRVVESRHAENGVKPSLEPQR